MPGRGWAMMGTPRRALPWALLIALLSGAASRRRPVLRPGKVRSQLTGLLQEVKECNASASSVLIMQNWTQLYNRRGDVFVNGMLRVTRNVQRTSKARVRFVKCTEEGTNCEPILTLRPGSESCAYWAQRHVFWTPVVDSVRNVRPPHRVMRCPIQEGYYELQNVTLDFNRFASMVPYVLTNSMWTVHIEAWDQDVVPWLCGHIRGKLIRYATRGDLPAR